MAWHEEARVLARPVPRTAGGGNRAERLRFEVAEDGELIVRELAASRARHRAERRALLGARLDRPSSILGRLERRRVARVVHDHPPVVRRGCAPHRRRTGMDRRSRATSPRVRRSRPPRRRRGARGASRSAALSYPRTAVISRHTARIRQNLRAPADAPTRSREGSDGPRRARPVARLDRAHMPD